MNQPTFIAGRQPLIEALRAGQALDKILLQHNIQGESIGEILKLAREKHIPVQQVPLAKLDRMAKWNHQGVIGLGSSVQYEDLGDTIAGILEKGERPLFLMLDGITDVRNIGAMARTAVCCGAQALIIPDKGIAAINAEAMKSSAGALASIRVCRVNSLLKAVDLLHQHGIRVFTSEIDAELRVQDLDFREATCIIMGSEGKGVQPYLRKAADAHFRIPMAGSFDSFNVGVAAGIILWEALKQRMA